MHSPGERRLAAIAVADVVGYSRMMAEDEDGTLATLRAHLNAIDPVILNHGGRVVKTTGDGMLVEFPSATAGLEAAAEVQSLMRERNSEIPESRRMQYRIGINLGDVVVDEAGDVFGDGVNVAARVESLADPGGISVTHAVYEAARGKVNLDFTDHGEHALKNIPAPVRVWKTGGTPAEGTGSASPARRTLATVAVLPFANMSNDPEQDYFADGITEDLLTALAYDRHLGVVARNSTFAYKSGAVDVRTIARELDATHVVEGSVRRAGDRVRVTAQLIDAETGHHIWAERYDRELDDIFMLQDELVEAITGRLRPTLWESAGERSVASGARSFDAWDLTIQGQYHMNRHTVDGFLRAIELFERARELEPEFAEPPARFAESWLRLAIMGWRDAGHNPWELGFADAEAAYRLDPDNYSAVGALGVTMCFRREADEATRLARRLIELNPHAGTGHHLYGLALAIAGRWDEAIAASTQAWRLGRHEPWRYDTANDLAFAQYMTGNYEAALTWGRRSLDLKPGYLQAHIALTAAYAQLGRPAEARPHVDAVLESRPDFGCGAYRSRLIYPGDEDRDHLIRGLLKAGLPE